MLRPETESKLATIVLRCRELLLKLEGSEARAEQKVCKYDENTADLVRGTSYALDLLDARAALRDMISDVEPPVSSQTRVVDVSDNEMVKVEHLRATRRVAA